MVYRVSRDVDTASGDLIPSSSDIFVEDELIILNGDSVEDHGSGSHKNATVVVTFTSDVFGNDKLVATDFEENDPATSADDQGDKASCGHPLTASQDTVTVNFGK